MPRACHVIKGLTYFLLSKGLAVDGDHPPRRTIFIDLIVVAFSSCTTEARNSSETLFVHRGYRFGMVLHGCQQSIVASAATDSTQSLSVLPCRRGDIQYSRTMHCDVSIDHRQPEPLSCDRHQLSSRLERSLSAVWRTCETVLHLLFEILLVVQRSEQHSNREWSIEYRVSSIKTRVSSFN